MFFEPPLFVLFIYIQELRVFQKHHLMRSIVTRVCVHHPNRDISEMKWDAVYDYAGKAGVNQHCPRLV